MAATPPIRVPGAPHQGCWRHKTAAVNVELNPNNYITNRSMSSQPASLLLLIFHFISLVMSIPLACLKGETFEGHKKDAETHSMFPQRDTFDDNVSVGKWLLISETPEVTDAWIDISRSFSITALGWPPISWTKTAEKTAGFHGDAAPSRGLKEAHTWQI